MITDTRQTIAAIASPPGHALRGVVRCSGDEVLAQIRSCLSSSADVNWVSLRRPASFAAVLELPPPIGPLDVELLVWPTQISYTRQPSIEIHASGSPPLLNAILARLAGCGIRQALPGEFTLRAFLAGRIDLTRAEAVLGVIESRSQAELDVALHQLAGGMAGPLEAVQELLLDVTARIEAGLDFVEEDIEFISDDEISAEIEGAAKLLEGVRDRLRTRAVAEPVVRVVLAGRPNAGKSSLFNALTALGGKTSEALVSDVAGTTRDYNQQSIEFAGVRIQLIDTAGIDSLQLVESDQADSQSIDWQAASAAQRVASQAHVVIFCIDGTENRAAELPEIGDRDGTIRQSVVVALTKCDLPAVQAVIDGDAQLPRLQSSIAAPVIAVSSVTGEGLEPLARQLSALATDNEEPAGAVASTAERCADCIDRAAAELETARSLTIAHGGHELVAGALRLALDEMALVTGRVYTDDILDRVFSRFCIGK